MQIGVSGLIGFGFMGKTGSTGTAGVGFGSTGVGFGSTGVGFGSTGIGSNWGYSGYGSALMGCKKIVADTLTLNIVILRLFNRNDWTHFKHR